MQGQMQQAQHIPQHLQQNQQHLQSKNQPGTSQQPGSSSAVDFDSGGSELPLDILETSKFTITDSYV